MDKEHLIQLTNNLYKLTLLFPKKEPLRYRMREIADEILDRCLRQNPGQNPLTDDLEVLNGFFQVAKCQNWVQAAEISKIQEEYQKIKNEIKKNTEAIQTPPIKKSAENCSPRILNGRQEKIIEFLRKNGQAQVWQVKQIFPEVTKRTIRRDFESMLKQGIIERVGERNNTFYKIKR